MMTEDGVKRGTGVRRLSAADRWDPGTWDRLRGLPWEHAAARKPIAGEPLIGEDRLVVPPPPEVRVAPPQQRRAYIRREDVHKHGAMEGCPGCQCVLDDKRTTLPHTEACRARIVEAMEQDEAGKARFETHEKKHKAKQDSEKVKPKVVKGQLEKDLSIEDAEGLPSSGAAGEATIAEYPEVPQERADMKRQSLPVREEGRASAKAKADASSPKKRTGELRIDPPTAKVGISSPQGVKRAPETTTEELETRQEAEQARTPEAASGGEPARRALYPVVPPTPPPGYEGPAFSFTTEKNVAFDHTQQLVKETYARNGIEITEQEVMEISSLSVAMSAVDVMEVYSPQRFTALSSRYRLKPGYTIDLNEQKPNGEYWNLNKEEDVKEAHEIVERDEPVLLTGSPPCNIFSQLQHISWHKIAPEVRRKPMDEVVHHLHTSCDLYEKQHKAGRKFLHEAPWGAGSWKDERVVELSKKPGVYVVRGPMCRWEMEATDKRGLQGTGYVRKETGWMTNDEDLAKTLEGICSNMAGKAPWHRHVHLIGGIA